MGQRVCQGDGKDKKKSKKHKREAEEDYNEEAAIEEIKNMSASELLDLAQDVAISEKHDKEAKAGEASPYKRNKRVAGIIALKWVKKYLNGDDDYEEGCHDIPHQHCSSVPVENCHDVKKCHYKPTTKCHKVPQQKCWEEPHEKCWQEPHEKCSQVPHEKCWEVPKEHCDNLIIKVAKKWCVDGDKKK